MHVFGQGNFTKGLEETPATTFQRRYTSLMWLHLNRENKLNYCKQLCENPVINSWVRVVMRGQRIPQVTCPCLLKKKLLLICFLTTKTEQNKRQGWGFFGTGLTESPKITSSQRGICKVQYCVICCRMWCMLRTSAFHPRRVYNFRICGWYGCGY